MESKRMNWNKILKSALAGIAFSLTCLLLGVFAILPFKSVKAEDAIISQEWIEANKINFIAAKTKVRTANEYLKVNLKDKKDTAFDTYSYSYLDEQTQFYKTSSSNGKLDNYSSSEEGYGNNSLYFIDGNTENLKTYDKIGEPVTNYIPSNAEYFYNSSTNSIENVFYDYIDEGDFVILDNYTSHNVDTLGKSFDVENFYISFGSRPDESNILIDDLEVEAYLYQPTEVHQLLVNNYDPIPYEDDYGNKKDIYYFNQFLDLKNIQGKKSGATNPYYSIQDQQGKYVFIFRFSMYNKLTGASTNGGKFIFTFHLLDNAIYNSYPTIETNNELKYISQDETREYYYNFNSENPTITYNPTQYALSYTRDNIENVTSEYSKLQFTEPVEGNGKEYPVEKIVYKNNDTVIKTTYILTYYNELKTSMEHLYLTSINTEMANNAKFEEYVNAINNGSLQVEYKITKELVITEDAGVKTYTINTYKSILSANYPWGLKDNSKIISYSIYQDDATINTLNSSVANYALTPRQIPIDIEYQLTFDDLGVYTFNYDYITVSSESNNVLQTPTIITMGKNVTYVNSATSTNKLLPEDPTLTYTKQTGNSPIQEVENKELVIKSWAYLKSDNTVTLNGDKFIYYPTINKLNDLELVNNTVTINNNNDQTLNTTNTFGDLPVKTTYKIIKVTDGNILEIHYTIGNYSREKLVDTFVNSENNIVKTLTTTTHTYSLDRNINFSMFSNDEEWATIKGLLNYLSGNTLASGTIENGVYVEHSTDYHTTSPNMDKDILHIFGSMAYYNLKDGSGEKAKFKYTDVNKNINYVSDVTKYYTGEIKAGFSAKIPGIENMIITTDKGPITWKNLSSLIYSDRISESTIYRYTSYDFVTSTTNGETTTSLMLGTPESNVYTKDMQVEFDGLYEVIVKYNYDLYRPDYSTQSHKEFYQLFTFIIDNSSPALNIRLNEEVDGDYTGILPTHKYTNKNVELSWKKPSYFQNDIYIKIQKTAYSDDYNNYNFIAKFSKGNITLESSSNGITNIRDIITDASLDDEDVFRVRLASNNPAINGNYKISLHCGINGAAATSKEFTIDKDPIEGAKVVPIIENANGTYSINKTADYYTSNSTSHIVNFDFTFRYNAKDSGANITTYWHKLNLKLTNDYDKLINSDNYGIGITTNYEVDGETSVESGNKYSYNYSTSDNVANNNVFINTNSAIYLFTLKDQAGNECRYVVFLDNTTPRFVMTPNTSLNSKTSKNIVNNTTQITFGDYKAIKIDTSSQLSNIGLTDYSKFTGSKIQEALNYIYSNGELFNDTEIVNFETGENAGYYLFLPISEIKVTDSNAKLQTTKANSVSYKGDTPDTFYFFAKDPLNEDKTQINLPQYSDNKLVSTKGENITNHAYVATEQVDGEIIDHRFISTTSTAIYGAIGQGEFEFQIYDKQRNLTSGYIWMNFDKTETLAYGIFNNKDTQLDKAIPLTGEEGSYSASKLFISSLEPSATVPKYSLTYKFYEYNDKLYESLLENYTIANVKILSATSQNIPNNLKIVGKETYLLLTYAHKTITDGDAAVKHITIQLTNELGKEVPKHSYPYDLEGTAIVADANGPQHIYSKYSSSYSISESTETRQFSTVINPVSDEKLLGNTVTEEGLYIFKRAYTTTEGKYTDAQGNPISDLGEDEAIIYRVYYIDRSGIINIATSNAIAETLYTNSAENFGFILGSGNTNGESLKKYISSTTIQNNESPYNQTSNASNSNNISANLFETNKVQVQFNITADKYNFKAFKNAFYNSLIAKADETTEDALTNYLFNTDYYSNYLYKLDLTLEANGQKIIDESSSDSTNIYNEAAISKYLIGGAYTKDGSTSSYTHRNTNFNMFRGTSEGNIYSATIKDNSGYRKFADNNSNIIENDNYLSNQLIITFNITHDAPEGDMYGKYYERHEYDENKSNNANHSIPFDSSFKNESEYRLLSKYLQEGKLQLQPLSSTEKSSTNSESGKKVTLFSTNNESLIFTFAINPDDYMAQIDPANLTIYKDGKIIFKVIGSTTDEEGRTKYIFDATGSSVSADRMKSSYIWNTVDGIMYYAVIIFDNNLDTILDEDEQSYKNYRLLDPIQNNDNAKYDININYVGNSSLYIDEKNSYSNTTYSIKIDRIKPTYNLTKLMTLDKYVYNQVGKQAVTPDTYNSLFNEYSKYYYPTTENGLKSPILDNYFFAVDYRPGTAFKFESISDEDATKGIYIRNIPDISNYKYSKTPDDYKTYYDAAKENPQFTPINAIVVPMISAIPTKDGKIDSNYYYLPYSLSSDPNSLSLSSLININGDGILKLNSYYEVIEADEAGNYRTYGIYIPNYTQNKISYTYKPNADSVEIPGSVNYNDNSNITINGMDFTLTNYVTNDYFLRASLQIKNELIYISYNPIELCIYIKDSNNKTINKISDVDKIAHADTFIQTINNLIEEYKIKIEDNTGYTIVLTILDRLGLSSNVSASTGLKNFVFTYNVAGDELTEVIRKSIREYSNYFTITIPEKTGTTNITKVRAYIFKNGWSPKDPDDRSNSFYKSEKELLKGFTYTLAKGVYKFEITDNFNRTSVIFHEFGTTTTQSGGSTKFSGNYVKHTDGYNYTSKLVDFVYDSTVYNIYIAYAGQNTEGQEFAENKSKPEIIYSNEHKLGSDELSKYGMAATTIDGMTTITMSGVNNLSKYFIKTVPASIVAATNYKWGDELVNNDILVYDNKIALYAPIQTPIVKNLNGIELKTDTSLNLSEDFEVSMKWDSELVPVSQQMDFGSYIELTRRFTDDNNITHTETIRNANKYTITKPGYYTAVVINALGSRSNTIEFTRGDGEITMYNVYNVDTKFGNTKLSPSTIVSKEPASKDDSREIIVFNYYTTDDYFSFAYENGPKISISDLDEDVENLESIIVDKQSSNEVNKKYLDVVVNSNLNVYIQICEMGKDATNGNTPYVMYRIYSQYNDNNIIDAESPEGEAAATEAKEVTYIYTYRFLKVYFLPSDNYSLVETKVTTELNTNQNILGSSNVIKRPDKHLLVRFTPDINTLDGNTLYIYRYYNNQLIDTINHNDISSAVEFLISDVGLHTFVIRDLAGRVQVFGDTSKTTYGQKLDIYLINQIIYTVNEESPINNQYFNGSVNIKVIDQLAGLNLYDTRILGINIYKDGKYLDSKSLTFTEPGYYTVELSTNTRLATDGSQDITDQEIFSTYNFTIIREDIAKNSFTVSKGDGFVIEKITKIVNDQSYEVTELHNKTVDNLLLLTHEKEGNSKFIITLKKFDKAIKDYRSFTFNVWINNESPVILSSITAGTSTKSNITLNFNPGKIYEQVGKAYIRLNNSTYSVIDENSENAVKEIILSEKGIYILEIVSEDGRVFSSYKFQKKNPINSTTKFVLIGAGIAVVVVMGLLFLVRKKGKYR